MKKAQLKLLINCSLTQQEKHHIFSEDCDIDLLGIWEIFSSNQSVNNYKLAVALTNINLGEALIFSLYNESSHNIIERTFVGFDSINCGEYIKLLNKSNNSNTLLFSYTDKYNLLFTFNDTKKISFNCLKFFSSLIKFDKRFQIFHHMNFAFLPKT